VSPVGIDEKMLGHWNLLEDFEQVLRSLPQPRSAYGAASVRERSLDQVSYLKLFLFGLFNPVVRTLRGLSAASLLPRVQQDVCRGYVRLSAFSEMQHVVQPEWLERVFGELSRQTVAQGQQVDRRLATEQWLAQDGSVFKALPRMAWALYGVGPKGEAKGVRLHLTFNLVEAKPQEIQVTPAIACERKVWRKKWKRGQAYVGDRHFAQDYTVFYQLNQRGCSFVFRLKDNVAVEVEEELPLSEVDRARGIVRQAWVRLGALDKYRSTRVRLIWIESASKGPMILVTNLAESNAPAELVLQIYRWRWQIELFFRWIKCVLGCDHWFAESPEGTKIQLYLALIAALLFQRHFGVRPNRRIMELLQFYFFGVASSEDLREGLLRELARIAAAKKR
jgi:hypothetical protein